MKLHLNTSLRSYLLSTFAVASGMLLSMGTVTLAVGSLTLTFIAQAQAEENTEEPAGSTISVPADTTITFDDESATGDENTTLELSGGRFYLTPTSGEFSYLAGKVNLVADTTSTMDGYQAVTSYTFVGDFTGSGTLSIKPAAKVIFAGSMAEFTGTMLAQKNNTTLTFGNGNACTTAEGSLNIFGNGTTLGAASSGKEKLVFNYSNESLVMNASLAGNAALKQQGSGELVLAQAFTSTGALSVESGSVTLGTEDSAADWSGSIAVNGGSLNVVNVADGNLGNISTAEGSTVTLQQDNMTLAGLSGNGTLNVIGKSLTINSITNRDQLAVADGFTLTLGGMNSGSVSVDKGGKLIIRKSGSGTMAAALTGTGDVEFERASNAIAVSGDNSAFAGTMTITGGTENNAVQFSNDNATGGEDTTLVLDNGRFYHNVAGGTFQAGAVDLKDNTVNVLDGSSGKSYTFVGDFTGSGTLEVVPVAVLNFTGSMAGFRGKLLGTMHDTSTRDYSFTFGNGGTCTTTATNHIFGDGVTLGIKEGTNDNINLVFNYSNESLVMNAALQGNVAIEQRGSGTLELNQELAGVMSLTATNNGSFTLSKGGSVSGLVSASNVTLGADSSFGRLNVTGKLQANGHTVTLLGDSSISIMDEGTDDHTDTGTSSLVVSGGTSQVTISNKWVNLKSLALSEEARLTFGASVSVADNITQVESSGTQLADGVQAGLETTYCVYVGSKNEDGTVREGTGNVSLSGNLVARGAYMEILGNATVEGNVSAGTYLSIGGAANISGNVSASNVTLGADSSLGQLHTTGTLSASGHTVTLAGDSSISNVAQGTSLSLTGGHTDLYGGTLQDLTLSGNSSVTIHEYMEAASLTRSEESTLSVIKAFKAGNDLYVGNFTTYWDMEYDTLINSGTLDMNTYDLTLRNGCEQGGIVTVAGRVTVGGDCTFTSLYTSGYGALYTNGNTITLLGNSNIQLGIHSVEGATQATSLVIAGGNTSVGGSTLKDVSIAAGSSLTFIDSAQAESISIAETGSLSINENHMLTVGTLTRAEGSDLNIRGALSLGNDLYVTHFTTYWDMEYDTLINSGTLDMNTYDLTLRNGCEQGGIVTVAGRVTVGGDCTFTSLYTSGYGALYTNGNTITLLGNSNIQLGIHSVEGATQATSLVIAGGNTSVGRSATLQTLKVAENAALTLNGNLHIRGELNAGSTNTEAADGQVSVSGTVTLEGSASNVAIAAQSANIASADGSELVLDSVDLALVTGNATLGVVRLTGDSSIRATGESQGVLTFERMTLVLGEHNSALAAQLMTMAAEDDAVLEGLANSATFGIQSDLLQNVALTEGGEMVIDLSYWAEEISRSGLENVTLTFGSGVDLSALSGVQVTYDGTEFIEASMVDGNVATFDASSLTVPEPTTASLSLLALAALAARRRRH